MNTLKNNPIIDEYKNNYKKFGYSPKALGWDKGKQNLRFYSLTNRFALEGCSILDIGCGFGDFNAYLQKIGIKEYKYLGIDITDDFINEAKQRYAKSNVEFINSDILSMDFKEKFDYVISSGVFNHKLIDKYEGGGYAFIFEVMKIAFDVCNKAISFDFLSDKVDYQLDHTFHNSPQRILEIGYNFSRNIILDNSNFPFEFCITIYKDDSYKKENTVFNIIEKKLNNILMDNI